MLVMENTFKRVVSDLKSRDFQSALHKIKEFRHDWTAGHAFKFLRTIAILVKELGDAWDDACGEIVRMSSEIVTKDATLTDTNDIIQGLIATYHLALHFLDREEFTVVNLLATCNLAYVTLTASEKSKEIQTVAVNLSHHLCKASKNKKIPAAVVASLRKTGLKLLLYGGPSRWLVLVEQINILVNIETDSDAYIGLIEDLLKSMDQLLILWNQENDPNLNCLKLQLWSILKQATFMLNSSSSAQTTCSPAQGVEFTRDFIDVILSLCDSEPNFKLELVKNLWKVIIAKGPHKDIACMLYLRIGAVAISVAGKIIVNALNKNVSTSTSTWRHFEFIADVLVEFYSKLSAFKDSVQKFLGMGLDKAEITCLTRATSIYVQLNLKEPTKECNSKTRQVFQFIDKVLLKNQSNEDYVSWIVTSVDPSSYNAGVAFYRQNRHEEASHFFRKSIDYLISVPNFRPLDEKSLQKASMRLDVLYDCRKATSAWSEFIQDMKHLVLHALWQMANESLDPAKDPWLQKLLQMWATFKRDLHLQENAPSGLLNRTLLDLLNDVDYSAHYPPQHDLLAAELRAYDSKKGNFPRSAITSVALQILPFAGSLQEKLRAQTFALADDSQLENLEKDAKSLVSSLVASIFKADDNERLELKSYLAVTHFRLHVASESLLKQKIKEETERIGPLLSSSSAANIPRGEDGSNNLNSGTDVSTLHCALKYSEKFSDSIVRCLEEWEDLVACGWIFEGFSNYVYGCVMSLEAYFSLQGNNYFRSRALRVQLKMARDLQLDDVFLNTAAEMMKLGLPLADEDRQRCEDVAMQSGQLQLEGLHYRIGKCYSLYYSGDCKSSKDQLAQILKSPTFQEQSRRTKSVVLIKSQACWLDSCLLLVPFALKWKPAPHEGPIESALVAFQDAYAGYKSHEKSAAQYGWDYPGVEWQVLGVYLKCAFHLASLYSYAGCVRENRHYLKEALVASQKHAVALSWIVNVSKNILNLSRHFKRFDQYVITSSKSATEAMLRLSLLDIVLNNAVNCEAKLACCYNFLVSSSVKLDPSVDPSAALQTPVAEKPPPKSRGRKIKDVPVNMSTDPAHRSLQMMGELPGASPTMRTRDVSEVLLTDFLISHASDCSCYRCSQELLYSLQCLIVLVQARMYSMQGMTEEATAEFQDRYKTLLPILSKFTDGSRAKAARSLFASSAAPDTKDQLLPLRRLWLQPAIRQLLDFRLHFAFHLAANGDSPAAGQVLEQLSTDTQQHVKGVIDHQLFKLMEKMSLLRFGLGKMEEKVESTTDLDTLSVDNHNPVPPTPACKPRRLQEPPKLERRNNMKKGVGQLFNDWEDVDDSPKFDEQDYMFSKTVKGKPAVLVIESSDDEGPTNTTPNMATKGPKTKVAKQKKDEDALCSQMKAVDITAQTPAPRTVRKKQAVKPIQEDETLPLPKETSAAFAFQTPAPATIRKTRKLKTADDEEEELAAAVKALTFQTPAPSRSRRTKTVQDKDDQIPAKSLNFQTPAPKSRKVKTVADQPPAEAVNPPTPARISRKARGAKPAVSFDDDDADDFQVFLPTAASKSRKAKAAQMNEQEVREPANVQGKRKARLTEPADTECKDESVVFLAACRTPAPRNRRTKPAHVEEQSLPHSAGLEPPVSVTRSTRRTVATTEENASEPKVPQSSASSLVRKNRTALVKNPESTSKSRTARKVDETRK